jgi:O-antigen/teichoic acid export membrane protein
MNFLTRVVKNTLSVLVLTLATKIVRVAAFFAIARVLSAAYLGEYSLSLACIGVVGGLSQFGVDLVTVRRISLESHKRGSIVASSIAAKLLLSIVAFGVALGAAFALGFSHHEVFLVSLAGLSLFSGAIATSLTAPFQAELAMSRVLTVGAWGIGIYAVLLCGVIFIRPSPALLILAALVADVAVLGLTFRVARRRISIDWPPDWTGAVSLIRDAAPLGLSTLFVAAYFRLDTLILRKIAGVAAVGYYSVAYGTTESLLLLASAYGNSLYPVFSARTVESGADLTALFESNYKPMVVGASLIAFLVTTFVEPVVAHFAPRYQPAALPIAVLIWSAVFMVANAITGVTINSLGWHRLFIRITALNLALNLALNILLIPRWGILGASLATVATEMVNFLQQAFFLRRLTSLRVHLAWTLPALAAGGAFLARAVVDPSMRVLLVVVLPLALASQLVFYLRSSSVPLTMARGAQGNVG